MKSQNYFVYILTNPDRHTVFYTGVTNNLEEPLSQHSLNRGSHFARQYNATKLIYYEAFPDPAGRNRAEEAAEELEPGKKGSPDCEK
jgi:predicted GIY-YIG superfamily endonuclease